MYIKSLRLASDNAEINFIKDLKRTCYNGVYPFNIFTSKNLEKINFAPITILYGGNGSEKPHFSIFLQNYPVSQDILFSTAVHFLKITRICVTLTLTKSL